MIPTKRLLSAVVLSVSYSSNKSPATGSDISKTALRYGDTSGMTNGGQNRPLSMRGPIIALGASNGGGRPIARGWGL